MLANLVNLALTTGLKKISVHSIPKKRNAKECSNYRTIAVISYASKVMLKSLQTKLQQYVNHELPDVQAEFKKGRGTRYQIANICWIIKKRKRIPEKKSPSAFLTTPKPLSVRITTNCGKFHGEIHEVTKSRARLSDFHFHMLGR